MRTMFNRNLLNLIIGELNRAVKYKVLTIGTGLSFIWLAIIFFMRKNAEEVNAIVPLLIFADSAMMSVMLVGASIFFEKQEGSIRSLLISPVTVGQILISKLINSVIIALISSLVVSIGAILITGIKINIFVLMLLIIIIVLAHAAIGFALSMVSKDFNSMLVNYMMFFFVFFTPALLLMMGIIPEKYDFIAMISPPQAGSILIGLAFYAETEWYKSVIAIVYLIAVAYLLMRYFVYPRFIKDAVRG